MFYARHRFSMAALALALLLAIPAPMLAQDFSPLATDQTQQVPQPAEGGVNWSGFGWGALSLLANIPYIPAKLLYATTGSLVGGDYVLTPGMLAGKDPISFAGPTSTAPAPAKASAATASSGQYGATVASSSLATPAVPAAPDQGTGPVGNRGDRSIE